MELLSATLTVAGMLLTFGITIGATKALIAKQEKEISDLKEDQESLAKEVSKNKDDFRQRFHDLHDTFVPQSYFKEVIDSIKETQKEMRNDVRKVLEILTENSK